MVFVDMIYPAQETPKDQDADPDTTRLPLLPLFLHGAATGINLAEVYRIHLNLKSQKYGSDRRNLSSIRRRKVR